MNLQKQILTFTFSFLFGMAFACLLKLNYKFIYQENKVYRILTTFFFVIIHILIYFILLQKINSGILHTYGMIAIISGFIMEYFVEKAMRNLFAKVFKRWYNSKG